MKVLLFSNLFPNPVDPQRGVFTYQLAKALSSHCELSIVTPLPWFPRAFIFSSFHQWYPFSQIPKHYKFGGFDVYSPKYLLLPKISEYMSPALIKRGSYGLIKKLHNTHQFDVINSHWLYPDALAMAPIAQKLGVSHVATALGCDVNLSLTDNKKKQSIKDVIPYFAGMTSVSNEMREKLINIGAPSEKIDVILNGVDGEKFPLQDKQACRKKLNMDYQGKIALYVGRLSEEKGINFLIDGFLEAQQERDMGRLYLVGDGDLRSELEAKVGEFGLAEKIYFMGSLPHSDICDWLGAADYLCLPSKREGCPNVVLEALSTGTPVIASRVGAIPDLLNTDNGLLCEPESASAIAEALISAQAVTWNAENIRQTVSHLTWDAIAKRYLVSYEKAILIGHH